MIKQAHLDLLNLLSSGQTSSDDIAECAGLRIGFAVASKFPKEYKTWQPNEENKRYLRSLFSAHIESVYSLCTSFSELSITATRIASWVTLLRDVLVPHIRSSSNFGEWVDYLNSVNMIHDRKREDFALSLVSNATSLGALVDAYVSVQSGYGREMYLFSHCRKVRYIWNRKLQALFRISTRVEILKYCVSESSPRRSLTFDFRASLSGLVRLARYGAIPSELRNFDFLMSRRVHSIIATAYQCAKKHGRRNEFVREALLVCEKFSPYQENPILHLVKHFDDEDSAEIASQYLEARLGRDYGREITYRVSGNDIRELVSHVVRASCPPDAIVKLHATLSLLSTHVKAEWDNKHYSSRERPQLWDLSWNAEYRAKNLLASLAPRILSGEIVRELLTGFSAEEQAELSELAYGASQRQRQELNLALIPQTALISHNEFYAVYKRLDYESVQDTEAVNNFFLLWLEVDEREFFVLCQSSDNTKGKVQAFTQLQEALRIANSHSAYLATKAAEVAEAEERRRHVEVISEIREVGQEVRFGLKSLDRSIRNLTLETSFQGMLTRRAISASGQALYAKMTNIEQAIGNRNLLMGVPILPLMLL